MQPGDRLVTALVNEHQVGKSFDEWLLHVTVVAWFRTPQTIHELGRLLTESVNGQGPFMVTMGNEERLGYQGRALVNLVRQPTPFMDIQAKVVRALQNSGADLMDLGTWGGEYKPHVTAQGGKRLAAGTTWQCDRLYIIEKQAGSRKRIAAQIPLMAA